tara:strand:- start:1559 stop:1675 length:117 start_codon:yes stop_codon:yes gene_type:complete
MALGSFGLSLLGAAGAKLELAHMTLLSMLWITPTAFAL